VIERLVSERRDAGRGGFLLQFGDLAARLYGIPARAGIVGSAKTRRPRERASA
jgi:hypothetical protein